MQFTLRQTMGWLRWLPAPICDLTEGREGKGGRFARAGEGVGEGACRFRTREERERDRERHTHTERHRDIERGFPFGSFAAWHNNFLWETRF